MGDLVRITHNDDGDKTDRKDWCAIEIHGDSERSLCTGEAFGPGESNARYKLKTGKVTCFRCKKIITYIVDNYADSVNQNRKL